MTNASERGTNHVGVTSMYRDEDRLVLRRAAYGEIAVHQEGVGRSVYLTRSGAVKFALMLLRRALL